MRNRIIINSLGAAAAGALGFIFIVSPAAAQTVTSQTATSQTAIDQPTATTSVLAKRKKPSSATPPMIDEAIQRTQARAAKAAATGKPEEFGSEEPFTYVPGKTF